MPSSRRLKVALAAVVLLAAIGAGPAAAAAHMLVGLQDDAQFLSGDPTKVFPNVKTLHVQIIRINLVWGGVNGVANTKPAHPMDPADRAYRWSAYDRAVDYAHREGAKVLFTIYGTPRWANGGKTPNHARLGATLQRFAYAAAKRYSGTFVGPSGKVIPPVRYWMAWNEPTTRRSSRRSTSATAPSWVTQSPVDYTKICKAVYSGVHGTLLGAEKVACGGTTRAATTIRPRAARRSRRSPS